MSFRRTREKTVAQYTEIAADRQRSALELNALSDSIRQLRKQRGMTQAELGIAIGTEQAAIARLESGRHAPSFRTLQAIARATSAEIDLFYRLIEPTVMEKRNTMTDTLNRPGLSTDRRHFLGGAMGLAGMLSIPGAVRNVSAQEATAAADKLGEFVWVEPDWGEERSLFTVVERGDETTIVETMDDRLDIPADPQRIVVLDDEQIAMFELGVAQNIVGLGNTSFSRILPNAGDLTDDLLASLADVPSVGFAWELDVEQVLLLEPDLILGNANYQPDDRYEILAGIAPFIRKPIRVTDAPRAGVRDFGALFGVEETAANLLADHNAYVSRAREAVAPFVQGKRVLIGEHYADSNEFFAITSHYIWDGEVSVSSSGYPAYRELGLTPTSFIETLAAEDREAFYLTFSLEELGKVDADIVLYLGYDSQAQYEDFLADPITKALPAYANNAIYYYDDQGFGLGLAGVRAAVKWIVETLTGEAFE
ncbi:MAG: ABC transporter substrate-binding protein [Thermomicrobiales bacterium]|nr:ABC transporter substrate-binding protein [Thermomicrobiales bacterium]MCO5223921.1 ABC transporter substrate-binding protein [Thermomicrobiales bacterium]MCO5227484.1 ABC transporter substrate-binding protein [Thermomicrobiales bacterium]